MEMVHSFDVVRCMLVIRLLSTAPTLFALRVSSVERKKVSRIRQWPLNNLVLGAGWVGTWVNSMLGDGLLRSSEGKSRGSHGEKGNADASYRTTRLNLRHDFLNRAVT